MILILMLAAAPPLPADVRDFLDRQENCDHWRGEEPYDAARAREIARGVAQSCDGLERRRARLARRHRTDNQAMRVLRGPED